MEDLKAERIDIGWCDPEYVSGHFAHSIATMARDLEYFGASGRIFRHSSPQQNEARNKVVEEFLRDSDSPWLWFVDGDMVLDKGHPIKLWSAASEHEADMVTGLAFIWKDGKYAVPSLFYENEQGEMGQVFNVIPPSGTEVAACGLASVLIHRRVFEAMQPHRHPSRRWFDVVPMTEIGATNETLAGVDVQFFKRARNLGFKLIVEPEAETWHLETQAISRSTWEGQWEKITESTDVQVLHFQEAADILNGTGVEWFLTDGALLGCVREGKLLPYDEDLDIGIWPEDVETVRAAFQAAGWPFARDTENQMWPYKYDRTVDIHTHYRNGDVTHKVLGLEGDLRMNYPAHLFYELRTATLHDRRVLIPARFDEYLETQYGKDWRVPKLEWDWMRDPLNIGAA